MEVSEIKKNIEKILDDNKAKSITSINLKNKIIFIKNKHFTISSTLLKSQRRLIN